MSVDHPYDTTASLGSDGDHASSTSAKDHAQQAAGTAADESRHVAGVAKDEAQRVASEAQAQVTHLLSEATTQVEEQSRTQRDRLVDTLHTLGDDLEKMAAQGNEGMASNLVHEGADKVRALSSRLDGREPRELLDDVRSYARRKPGTFLLGALAAGVVAGRLTRGARDAQHGSASSGSTYGGSAVQPAGYGTASGTPLAGTAVPASTPVYPAADRGLPNQAAPGVGETTWADTPSTGGRS